MLYIVSVGLYELFVGSLVLPPWLIITDLDDLKTKLIGVVIVLLGVTFLQDVVVYTVGPDILYEGAAIAIIIGALAYYMARVHESGNHTNHSTDDPPSPTTHHE